MSWWKRLFTREPTMPDFHAASIQHWQALKAIDSNRRSAGGWKDEGEREAFQLLKAAVLYLANSLPHLGLLHGKWRLPPLLPKAGAYLNDDDDFPRGLFLRANETIGQMHLASAAVRLPVALQKTIEAYPGAEGCFGDLWGIPPRRPKSRPDWLRCNIKERFQKVKILDHCVTAPLGRTDEERLQHAMTVIMVVRDDFGHGEEGDSGPGSYMGDRKAVVDALHTCRIVEAEQLLIGWAVEWYR